jgi:hypothetical protein
MTITEAQHQASSPEAAESTHEGPMGSTAKAGKGLWIAILALGAVIALALAAALGAFDGSSGSDGTTVESVDARLDSDFHRTPPAGSVTYKELVASSYAAPRPVEDGVTYEELVASSYAAPRPVEDSADQVDPRQDSDFHREP